MRSGPRVFGSGGRFVFSAKVRYRPQRCRARCRDSALPVETTWVVRNRPGITDHALAQALFSNLEEVGAPSYDDDYVQMTRYAPTVRSTSPAPRCSQPRRGRLCLPRPS